MSYWAAVVTGERYAAQLPYAFETVTLTTVDHASAKPGGDAPDGDTEAGGAPAIDDVVALIAAGTPAGESPVLFGLGRVRERTDAEVTVRYTHRLFDDPLPVEADLPLGLTALAADEYARLAGRVEADCRTDAATAESEWFVSLTLPIEAASRAEAVREFWTYVDKLGPSELPAFVWPRGHELAMQAFVLGTRVNLDPEEDDD